jgi:hypothetical protein
MQGSCEVARPVRRDDLQQHSRRRGQWQYPAQERLRHPSTHRQRHGKRRTTRPLVTIQLR